MWLLRFRSPSALRWTLLRPPQANLSITRIQQLRMLALFHQASTVHHQYLVGIANGQAMGNHDYDLVLREHRQGVLTIAAERSSKMGLQNGPVKM